MSKRVTISRTTRTNWLIDAAVFLGAVAAALTGIYFLFLPSGGYQGGRNPMYGVAILFGRRTWDDVHMWGGVLMIAAVAVHLATHWGWVKMMTRRVANAMRSQGSKLSRGAIINVIVDLAIAISFLLTSVSGLYFLFVPSGGSLLAANANWDPSFLVSRTTWDLIHTWAGATMIIAAVLHLAIHWRWIKNVTSRFFVSLWRRPDLQEAPAGR